MGDRKGGKGKGERKGKEREGRGTWEGVAPLSEILNTTLPVSYTVSPASSVQPVIHN